MRPNNSQESEKIHNKSSFYRASYASAVLGVVILSIRPSFCLSVCHMHALWLIQRTYWWYFYTTWKGNPSSQMWLVVQLCSSWQDFNWLKGSRGLSAAAELLVVSVTSSARWRHLYQNSAVDTQINGREREKLYWTDSKHTRFILEITHLWHWMAYNVLMCR